VAISLAESSSAGLGVVFSGATSPLEADDARYALARVVRIGHEMWHGHEGYSGRTPAIDEPRGGRGRACPGGRARSVPLCTVSDGSMHRTAGAKPQNFYELRFKIFFLNGRWYLWPERRRRQWSGAPPQPDIATSL
jgi:hypothetical protein